MTATRWFLALCALAFLAACGGNNGSDTAEDVFIGADPDAVTPDPDAVTPDLIGGDTVECIPPTDSSDDSTAIETTETTTEVVEDVCSEWNALGIGGKTWECVGESGIPRRCTLAFTILPWEGAPDPYYCFATCDEVNSGAHSFNTNAPDIQWNSDYTQFDTDGMHCVITEE